MKIIFGLVSLASATTECNGSKYSPLGCFTDDPPFYVAGNFVQPEVNTGNDN